MGVSTKEVRSRTAMKYFTLEWWASEDQADKEQVRTAYWEYFASIESDLPPKLLPFVSFHPSLPLHDANLLNLDLRADTQELMLHLEIYS